MTDTQSESESDPEAEAETAAATEEPPTAEPDEDLEYATAEDFAHLHTEELDITVPTEDGERKIRVKKLNQRHRDEYFENGIAGLEADRDLAAKFIDEMVLKPDFAEAFGVEELEAEHLDDFGIFSFQTIFFAVLEASGIEVSRQNQQRLRDMAGDDMGDFPTASGGPPS